MASMIEEVVVIKVTRLVKDGVSSIPLLDKETLSSIEAVMQELVGSALVELQVA